MMISGKKGGDETEPLSSNTLDYAQVNELEELGKPNCPASLQIPPDIHQKKPPTGGFYHRDWLSPEFLLEMDDTVKALTTAQGCCNHSAVVKELHTRHGAKFAGLTSQVLGRHLGKDGQWIPKVAQILCSAQQRQD